MTIEVQRPELEALIRDWMKTGAFATVEDALSLMGVHASALPPADDLEPLEAEVLAAVPSSGAYLDEVAGSSQLPVRQAGIVLTSLELKGRVWLGSDGRVSRRL